MDNTSRFTGRVSVYERYRQRYPAPDVLDALRRGCGLQPDWLVTDVGAGTGMLSEVFLANGNPVLAIEPNADMRSACAALQLTWPSLQLIDATAEATTCATASIDIVTVGRAFHWFNRDRALTEFRRILKPNGWLALVSLGRSNSTTPQSTAFEHLLTQHGTDYNYVRAGYRIHDNLDEILTTNIHQALFHSEQHLDWTSFLGQMMSLSVVPQPGDPRFPGFQIALRSHFDEYAIIDPETQQPLITMPTTCWVNVGHI